MFGRIYKEVKGKYPVDITDYVRKLEHDLFIERNTK